MIAEVAYVGNKITHLFWNRQDNANDPLLLAQYGARLERFGAQSLLRQSHGRRAQLPNVSAQAVAPSVPALSGRAAHPPANYGDATISA